MIILTLRIVHENVSSKLEFVKYEIDILFKIKLYHVFVVTATLCPGSSYPIYIASYYIKWVTTYSRHTLGSGYSPLYSKTFGMNLELKEMKLTHSLI